MNPFDILDEVRRRGAEAIVAQSGLSHDGLRRHLRAMVGGSDGGSGGLLQQPILEGAHPFVTVDETMAELAGGSLHPRLVDALDALAVDHEYRFPRSRHPFRHQADAWRLLAEREPQSVLVTSGTGSGKTECFLFPVLSDLVAQATEGRGALEGVQAIMLYPLNALIESQRERLSAWTAPFGGKLRYCLYNGDLQRSARQSERRVTPEQVIDREALRASPPPILVTNITMLEYMLVRADDRPIIEGSRGRLKWIVLDEAHSLVGAAAAEIALLLRRVMLAFQRTSASWPPRQRSARGLRSATNCDASWLTSGALLMKGCTSLRACAACPPGPPASRSLRPAIFAWTSPTRSMRRLVETRKYGE